LQAFCWDTGEKMRCALLEEHAKTPTFSTFQEPRVDSDEHQVVQVTAAAISRVDISLASGKHYLGAPPLPSVPGREGVGALGQRRVYFDSCVPPFGAFGELVLVKHEGLLDVLEGVDDAVAAALGNSGLAALLPLEWSARLQANETVLVLGATGVVGGLAAQLAKLLGASRVVASGRDEATLQSLVDAGHADSFVVVGTDESPEVLGKRLAEGGKFNVIVDYVGGAIAAASLHAASVGARYVNIGHLAGPSTAISLPMLRRQLLSVLGFANHHVPLALRQDAYRRLQQYFLSGELKVSVERVPLSQVQRAWEEAAKGGARRKLVLVMREEVQGTA